MNENLGFLQFALVYVSTIFNGEKMWITPLKFHGFCTISQCVVSDTDIIVCNSAQLSDLE